MNTLNFNHKLLSLEYKDWIKNYVNGQKGFPQIIELDPTSKCMFKCPECINSNLINKKDSFTNDELLELIEELSQCGVKGIIFIGGGEPLMHLGFGKAIEKCNEKKINVGITTNGLLIDRYINQIAEYAKWTRVSIDAANEKTFKRVRPNDVKDSLERIFDNMRELSKIKKGILGYSFLIIEDEGFSNVNEVFEAAKIAKNLGCDYFEIKPMVDSKHFLVKYSDNLLDKLYVEIDKALQLQNENFKIIYPKSLLQYKNLILEQPKEYKSCPASDLRTVITPYGTFPCPYKRGYEQFNLGNVKDGFKNIWFSKDKEDAISKLDPSTHCKFFCIRDDLNILINSLIEDSDKLDEIQYNDEKDVFV
ncbi:Radical SAM superfamily enzyme, MoaA/NifB/PqqE/SkfB family [Clostridium cavendishii DSM 21758]|uniref:Radical SAM superfamily enzyme, MoaA/NifB/PqqE/SkfB family n=1 Tax=Clostridium cavendishii DSM 21758 TaxID=1121302 RepID=A0A1M6IWS0_9CLOT|nr:radical SAM protein [Clostridium cavendishii]SHJ38906.1 Radical SAM superfamily enzyme, MoaA/NifB/PqqE/SkfB family [Clostridium cavendishii DSM 21758]